MYTKLNSILGSFAKLRKATSSFYMSVRPLACVLWNNSAPIGRTVIKFCIRVFFQNLPRKFKFQYNRTRIKSNYVKTYKHTHTHTHTRLSYSENKEMFRTEVVETIRTRILCSITFCLGKSCPSWDNTYLLIYLLHSASSFLMRQCGQILR